MMDSKRKAISDTLRQTKERRKGMVCKVFKLKVDRSHLSKKASEILRMIYLEAKWLTNHAIANSPFSVDYKTKEVPVKVGDLFEPRKLSHISSQMKQALIDRLKQDIYNLNEAKNNGKKVGKLKFKSRIRTIPLKQYGNTFRITGKNHIAIQNIPQKLRVRGLKQIPDGAEIAKADLINDYGDYFIHVTTYIHPANKDKVKDKAIGLDIGMREQMVFSNGVSLRYRVSVTKRIKKLYQRISKTEKNSNNRFKARLKLQKEFSRITSIKSDIKNKIVSFLRRNYAVVCYQDDNIQSWQRVWGRKILDTAIGGIKDILEERISTPVEVDRNFPSTYLCQCGSYNEISLNEEIYTCSKCGLTIHRDVKAAISILYEGLKQLPVERREAILPDVAGRQACGKETSTLAMLEYFNSIPRVSASLLYETGSLNALA